MILRRGSATLLPARYRSTTPCRVSIALCVLAALLLGACAAGPKREPILPYQPPSSGETARLVSRGIVPAGDAYLVSVLADDERCERPGLVGSGNALQHPPTTNLAAGRPATVEFEVLKASNLSCRMRWTFTPAAGKAYLITGVGMAQGCSAVISDMSDVEHLRREPAALRRNPTGSRCVPLAESKPVPVVAAASAASAADAVLHEGATSADLEGLIAP